MRNATAIKLQIIGFENLLTFSILIVTCSLFDPAYSVRISLLAND